MRALSIRQPWAWLIVNGFKDIENRTWPTRKTGSIFVHTGLKMADNYSLSYISHYMQDSVEYERMIRDLEKRESFGGIVGQVDIVECVDYHESDWFDGPWGWVLKNAKTLPFKPCKGKLSFFKVDN